MAKGESGWAVRLNCYDIIRGDPSSYVGDGGGDDGVEGREERRRWLKEEGPMEVELELTETAAVTIHSSLGRGTIWPVHSGI